MHAPEHLHTLPTAGSVERTRPFQTGGPNRPASTAVGRRHGEHPIPVPGPVPVPVYVPVPACRPGMLHSTASGAWQPGSPVAFSSHYDMATVQFTTAMGTTTGRRSRDAAGSNLSMQLSSDGRRLTESRICGWPACDWLSGLARPKKWAKGGRGRSIQRQIPLS